MKKILLLGDSIRQGYDSYIKEHLAGIAEVSYPEDNCRFVQYLFRTVCDWKDQLHLGDDVDLVHWNAGLWDCLIMFQEELLTPPEVYGDFIARTQKRLQLLFPKAKFIFATSTPVLEEGFTNPDFKRFNKDIELYNRIAAERLAPYSVEINDLYALLKDVPKEYHSDATHYYTPVATEYIGSHVLKTICGALDLEVAATAKENYQAPDKILGI